MLDIPFYKSIGHRCAESCVKSVINYYFPHKENDLKEIGGLLKRKSGKLVYPVQIANALINLGLDVDYYSSYGIERFLDLSLEEREKEFHMFYGESAKKIMKHTDFQTLKKSAEEILLRGYNGLSLKPDNIECAFLEGKLIICLLNYDLLVNREDNHNGHYTLITDIDNKNIYYHEVGPRMAEKNKRVEKERFFYAWNKMCLFDEGTVIVSKQ
mgnify:CR=1 FL=1